MTREKKLLDFGVAREFLKNIGGDEAITVVALCEKKGRGVKDEELAEKMKLRVTEIRTALNRLHYRGIAYYNKTKNKRTGWYSYTWQIKPKRVVELLLEEQGEKMQRLETKRDFEQDYAFFSCKSQCNAIPFEIAAEYNFKCPECGRTMGPVDNKKRLDGITRDISELKKTMEALVKMG